MNKLFSFVKQFTKATIPELDKVKIHKNNYYLIEDDTAKICKKIDSDPYSQGLFLGSLKTSKFMSGFPLLDLIAEKSNKVIINKKGETMFLYRRNILDESIVKSDIEEGMVIVVNESKEVLGYGEIIKKDAGYLVKNIFNRSHFLKREE